MVEWAREMGFGVYAARRGQADLTLASAKQLCRGPLRKLWAWLVANVRPRAEVDVRVALLARGSACRASPRAAAQRLRAAAAAIDRERADGSAAKMSVRGRAHVRVAGACGCSRTRVRSAVTVRDSAAPAGGGGGAAVVRDCALARGSSALGAGAPD